MEYTLEREITETIQKIGAIFGTKNIVAAPYDIIHRNPKIEPGMERMVVLEMLIHLEDLFHQYKKKTRNVHKYKQYIYHFYQILDDNTNENTIVSQRKQIYG